MSQEKLKPAFQKYAGKIINIAEVKALVAAEKEKPWRQLKHTLLGPVHFIKKLANSFRAKPSLESMQFYVTKEANEANLAIYASQKIQPQSADSADGYFEASKVLNGIYLLAGPGALPHFLRAVAAAPDHARDLADGKLVQSGFAISINLNNPSPVPNAILLTPDTPKYNSLTTLKFR